VAAAAAGSTTTATTAPIYYELVVSERLSFAAAEAHCKSAYGTNLASMHSDAEWEAVKHAIRAAPGYSEWDFKAWVGASDTEIEGTFTWTDGTPVNYTRWGSGEGTAAAEDCVAMGRYHSEEWQDYTCGASFPFVCRAASTGRATLTATPPSSESGSCACATGTQSHVYRRKGRRSKKVP